MRVDRLERGCQLGTESYPKVAAWAARLGLALASVLFVALIFEYLVFPRVLPELPLGVQVFLPPEIATLAQSSKAGTVPERYIALTGDSYAQGLGDWLHSADPDTNPPYHSAHVLHELSGRDVVTVARGGAGSLTALVFRPLDYFRSIRGRSRFPVERPELLIAYYYEGNDLEDTLLELAKLSVESGQVVVDPGAAGRPLSREVLRVPLGNPALGSPRSMRAFIEAAHARRSTEKPPGGFFDSLYFSRFVLALAKGQSERLFPDAASPGALARWSIPEAGSRVVVGGDLHDLPEALQGPALELDEASTDLALAAYREALGILVSKLEETRLCVVYIPSPLVVYRLAGEGSKGEGEASRGPNPPAVQARSRALRDRVGALVRETGTAFVDATPGIQRAGKTHFLHGPRDWRHLNQRGYRELAGAVQACLGAEGGSPPKKRFGSYSMASVARRECLLALEMKGRALCQKPA